jgi:uncharacterized membrane protein YdbT with pleckstrin-like domain
MAEEQLWKGQSSQWKNAVPNAFLLIAIGVAVWLHRTYPWGGWAWVVVAVIAIYALGKWLVNKTTTYQLTTERLVTTRGILTKVTDTLELYRVRDLQTVQPLLLRMLGLENVHLFASDATTEVIIIDYLPASLHLGDQLRKAVEACREKKRVRALDVVNEDGPGGGADSTALS